jgi:hypothetical protein
VVDWKLPQSIAAGLPSPSGATSCLNNGNNHDGNNDLKTLTCQRNQ